MNEKFEVEVYKRKLTLELDGITQLEVNALARELTDRITEVENRTKVVDSSKLAILTALELLRELQKHQDARSTERIALDRKVEEMTLQLRAALSHAEPK